MDMESALEYMNNIIENTGKNSNSDDILDDIYRTEQIIEDIEKDIKKLWNNVIMRYKDDLCRSQILDKLDEHSYNDFYRFMIKNNRTYKKATKLLKYLHNLEH